MQNKHSHSEIDDFIAEYEEYGYDVNCINAVAYDTLVYCVYLHRNGVYKNVTLNKETLEVICSQL